MRLAPGLLGALALGCAPPPPADAPHVVLLSIESVRVDHVGAYGGASPVRPEVAVTPALDALAKRATLYQDAHSVTSWTLASHASLFTGLYPSAHHAVGPRDRLADALPTLAEVLAERGYATTGIVSGPYLRRNHRLDQGFQHYDDSIASIAGPMAHDDVTNPLMVRALERFLEEREAGRPFFLFAYFWDSHYDFLPPPPYDTLFVPEDSEPLEMRGFETNPEIAPGMPRAQLDYLLAQYAGDLRWTDAHVGRFLEALEEQGLWDETLIIVTADHGEEFFDHGAKGHKNNLHAETVRVPLIVKYPGQREGRRDARPVSLVDVLPTVLDLAGGAAEHPVQGVSLLGEPAPDRTLLYELRAIGYFRGEDGRPVASESRWQGVRRGAFKWIERLGEPPLGQLYDVERDPAEREALDGEPARRAALSRALEAELARTRELGAGYPAGGVAELSRDEMEQLRELGYLGQ